MNRFFTRPARALLVACSLGLAIVVLSAAYSPPSPYHAKIAAIKVSLATAPCDFTCDPDCPSGFQGTFWTPQDGWVNQYHGCSFFWDCLDHWCWERPGGIDDLTEVAQKADVDDVVDLLTSSPKLLLNDNRHALQIATCTGDGVVAHLQLTDERYAEISACLH